MKHMGYDEFKEQLLDELKERLRKSIRAEIIPISKNGVIREAIGMEEGLNEMKPLVYVENLYDQYRLGAALSTCAGFVMGLYNAIPEFHVEQYFETWEEVKPKITIRLVNWEWNRDELTEIPYQKYLDLAVYCRIVLGKNEDGIISNVVRKSMLRYWKISESELWDTAKSNFQKEEFLIRHIDDEIGYPKCYLDKFANLYGKKDETYVLTNEYRNHGASGMLRLDILKEFAERMDGDLFILPSSLNEVILLPDRKDRESDFLRSLVQKNNRDYAVDEELSENLYYYRREKNRIEVVL